MVAQLLNTKVAWLEVESTSGGVMCRGMRKHFNPCYEHKAESVLHNGSNKCTLETCHEKNSQLTSLKCFTSSFPLTLTQYRFLSDSPCFSFKVSRTRKLPSTPFVMSSASATCLENGNTIKTND